MNPDIILPKTKKIRTYTALLTQTSTNAPTETILQNTLGYNITWTRQSNGTYIGETDEPFDSTKACATIQKSTYSHNISITVADAGTAIVVFTTGSGAVGVDNVLLKTMVEFKIYDI